VRCLMARYSDVQPPAPQTTIDELLHRADLLPDVPRYARGGSRKNVWGAGPSSFGRQQQLSEITIKPITSNVWKVRPKLP